jgi:uncharacterized protein YigA (DUF484 family)
MTATIEKTPAIHLDPETVRSFLIGNPAFIQEDAELFSLLASRDGDTDIVDLGSVAREKLLHELRQLKALNEGIVETARSNLAVQSQIHMAVLALLEAESMATLDRKFAGRVAGALGVDVCRIFIEGHAPLKSAESILGAGEGLISLVLDQKIERLGPVRVETADSLYGPQANRVQSEAIVRLDFHGHDGLMAVASRDPNLFQAGQGTELLNFLARTLERLIIRWMHAS